MPSWIIPTPASGGTIEPDAVERAILGRDIYWNGDYAVAPDGDYLTVDGVAAVRQAIYLRLITSPGEFAFDPTYGCGVADFVADRGTAARIDALRTRIRDNLLKDDRVEAVGEIAVEDITNGIQIHLAVRVKGKNLRWSYAVTEEKE